MKSHKLLVICLIAIVAFVLIASPVMAQGFIKSLSNPIVTPTDPGETQGVGAPWVIYEAGGVYPYKMWYTGIDAAGIPSINYAESTDGIVWLKSASNPIFEGALGGWDAGGVGGACVFKDGSVYKMYYTGLTGAVPAIGLAWSTDGITNWNRVGLLPVLSGSANAADWDGWGVAFPSVIKNGLLYQMWYTGRHNDGSGSIIGNLGIGYATSGDGLLWIKNNPDLPVMTASAGWDNRGVGACSVQYNGSSYHMLYTGFMTGVPGVICRIGETTSTDPAVWTNGVTVLDEGAAPNWDEKGVATPTWIVHGGQIQMWYTGAATGNGAQGSAMQIGEAHTENPPVPASTTTSVIVMIAGLAAVIGAVSVWNMRRAHNS